MRLLILGGSRFMGPYVVHRLVELGHQVAVFNRGISAAPLPCTTPDRGSPATQHLPGCVRALRA